MKKIKIFFAALSLGLLSISPLSAQQYVNYGNDEPEIQNMIKNPLYIVASGDKVFDDALAASVEKYWKQSASTKVISKAEMNKYMKDKNNYFIAPVQYHLGIYMPNAKELSETCNLAVFNGKYNKLDDFKPFMVIATAPFMLLESKEASSMTDYLVKAMNEGVDITIKNDLKGKPGKKTLFAEINKKSALLKTKKLLIPENMFDEKALAKYKLPYEVKTSTEIEKIIKEGSKEYCLVSYRFASDNKNFFVFDLETKDLVYATFTMNGMPPGGGDLVRISETAAGKAEK